MACNVRPLTSHATPNDTMAIDSSQNSGPERLERIASWIAQHAVRRHDAEGSQDDDSGRTVDPIAAGLSRKSGRVWVWVWKDPKRDVGQPQEEDGGRDEVESVEHDLKCVGVGDRHREERHTDGCNAGDASCDAILASITVVRRDEDSNRAKSAHQNVPHGCVVVATDGFLNAFPLRVDGQAKREAEGQSEADDADTATQDQMRNHKLVVVRTHLQ